MSEDTSKTQPSSGSAGSGSTKKKSAKSSPAESERGMVRLKSLTVGGENPGSGVFLPPEGTIFETDAETGKALIACGLAELKGE